MSTTLRLLAIAALLAVVYSRSFVQRIERHRPKSSKAVGGGHRAGRLPALGHRNSRLDVGSQPLIDYYDDYYLGNVTIGDDMTFTVAMDTGSSNMWVIDCACRQLACKGNPDSGYRKHCYNASVSEEYTPNGKPFSIRYGKGDVSGYLAEDFVFFGGKLFDVRPTFGVATTSPTTSAMSPSMGFSPILFEILDELDQPLFTIYLERHVKLSFAAPGGFITYGAVDTQHCDAQIYYVPLTQQAWWQFEWDGFTVGKSNFPGKQQVISDSGTSWLYLLTPHFEALIKEIGAELDFTYGLYTVGCDAKIPDIVLTIGGKKYNIPSNEYVLDLGVGGGQCVVAAKDAGATSPFDQPAIILGDVFLRAYCNVYDIGQKRIGFAKAHHKEI